MEKWFVAAKKADFEKWSKQYHIDPVLARIIRNRDITEEKQVEQFLYGTMKNCPSPWLLHGMEKAVALLEEEIRGGGHIRVIGDYDVDGICASYILTEGLKKLGAWTDTAIPHRIRDGYGLNDALIEEAHQEGVHLILTCDNGIAAAEQIARAKDLGMTVVVTDHHEVPYEESDGCRKEKLPPADVIIDPKQEACNYPFSGICGAVVGYKLILALCQRMNAALGEQLAEDMLPFAALATVCDVMELKEENRIIVREGLKRMAVTENAGLKALVEVNGLEPDKLSAYHLGFVLGPCLNATGRLDTALRALELLQSDTRQSAFMAATELKELNDSRKALTLQGIEEAEQQIRKSGLYRDKVMVIFLPRVHESLAGIIAGRIRERYNRPVFVLTRGEEGIKGSGRSIEAYHMYQAMAEVGEYFVKFGGHKGAAGLSMQEENIEPLRRALNERAALTEEDFVPKIHIDVPMPISYANKELAKQLELLEPFGVGNPKPLFAQKDVVFVGGRRIGAKQNFGRFTVLTGEDGFRREELMYFGDLEEFCLFLDKKYGEGSAEKLFAGAAEYRMSITYQMGINRYKGREAVQYIMQNYA